MPETDSVVQVSALKRLTRSRSTRFTAAAVVTGLAVGAVITSGGGAAGAATPRAQSVGRFLDGAAGGMALQSLVDLKDARAKAAPNASKRNPLNANLFDAADIPIGNGLKLPGGGVFQLGAANQIAVAKTDEYSYGAAGAVDNSGGAQLTDKAGKFPSDGTINLSGAALGSVPITGLPAIPGLPAGTGTSASAIGGIVGKIGAVQALAQTETGGKIISPQSSVASVQLAIGSPALGALLSQLKSVFNQTVLDQILSALPTGVTLPAGCQLTAPDPSNLSLENGAVTVDITNATIDVNVGPLLKTLTGIDISHLKTSNFDLIKFLVQNLPKILSTGLEGLVTSLTDPLETAFGKCQELLGPLGALVDPLVTALKSGETQIKTAVAQLETQFDSASGSPLAMVASALNGAVDIGLNVQSGPKIQPRNTDYKYSTQLAKTPDQATNVVKGQSLVRAIEIDLLDASGGAAAGGLPTGGLPPVPGLPGGNAVSSRQLAGKHAAAAAAGDSVVSLALGNAAAGPSSAAPRKTPNPTPTTATPTSNAPTTLPTGVPAGAAGHDDGGSPLVPAALLLLGLVVAGGGVLTLRTRGKFGR